MTAPPLTWLYAPGDRPRVVAKALAAGADVVVVDLEDAVRRDRKAYARAATAELLRDPQPVPVHVRVNALDSPSPPADLAALAPAAGPVRAAAAEGLLPGPGPGSPRPPAVHRLYALLETALGVEHAHAVATAHPALRGIALGEADLRADLGMREDTGLDWSRARVVVAARAAGLAPPSQSVHPDTRDLEGLAASCARGRALGFLGRAAIHPRQLPIIERAYLPTERELEQAETILKAARPAGRAGAARRPVRRRGGGGDGGAPDARAGAPALTAGTRRGRPGVPGALGTCRRRAVSPSWPSRPRPSRFRPPPLVLLAPGAAGAPDSPPSRASRRFPGVGLPAAARVGLPVPASGFVSLLPVSARRPRRPPRRLRIRRRGLLPFGPGVAVGRAPGSTTASRPGRLRADSTMYSTASRKTTSAVQLLRRRPRMWCASSTRMYRSRSGPRSTRPRTARTRGRGRA
ncbi:hypothetical protein STENM223S_03384 [Streptomyces tendae]